MAEIISFPTTAIVPAPFRGRVPKGVARLSKHRAGKRAAALAEEARRKIESDIESHEMCVDQYREKLSWTDTELAREQRVGLNQVIKWAIEHIDECHAKLEAMSDR